MQALFFRDYRKFHGGSLKVWDYFGHARTAPGWDAWIQFAPRSRWDPSNPWHGARDRVLDDAAHLIPDLFFVSGRDWQWLDRHPAACRDIPVVNLLQHVRHAQEASSRYDFLSRPAVRVCVSEAVASAILATGLTKGPVLTIPNGLDLEAVDAAARPAIEEDLLIVGIKRSELARDLAEHFVRPGLRVRVLVDPLPRREFLGRISSARVSLFLPNETEGFYLPALEGMALGTIVVCPDCVGNRSFVVPGATAFMPDYQPSAIVTAVEDALALGAGDAAALRRGARAMAERHDIRHERAAFWRVLADLNRYWSEARG